MVFKSNFVPVMAMSFIALCVLIAMFVFFIFCIIRGVKAVRSISVVASAINLCNRCEQRVLFGLEYDEWRRANDTFNRIAVNGKAQPRQLSRALYTFTLTTIYTILMENAFATVWHDKR